MTMMAEVPPAADDDLRPIADICDGEVSFKQDGWRRLIFMQSLHFYSDGKQFVMDALLCLNHNNPTYPTKLYLAETVGTTLNWNEQAYILGRNWHTFSWRDVKPDQPPIKILADHLSALHKRKCS